MNSPRYTMITTATTLCLALLLAVVPANADTPSRGLVDSSPFEDLGGDECLSLYVNLGPTLLRLMSITVKSEDPDLAKAVARLEGISAVFVDLNESCGTLDDGVALLKKTVKDLQRKKWERLALIRDSDAEIHVLILGTEEEVEGLVMLMHDKDESEPQLMFVNIVGLIDLAKLQELGEAIDIEALQDIEID